MPCKGTTKKGRPCRKPCKGDWCLSHQPDSNSDSDLEGDGLWDDAKSFVKERVKSAFARGPRTSASTRFQKFLDKNEDHKVVKVQLGRKPIVPLVHKAMDFLSAGRFSKAQKAKNYDQVFHNYILVTLDDGRVIKLEKNETVIEKAATKGDFSNEVWDIPLKGRTDLTMKKMVETASTGNEKRFYKYRADSDNCQRFTRDLIEKNGLLPADDPKHVQVQDAKSLVNSLPGGSFIPNAVTDLASIGDRALYGDGFQGIQNNMRPVDKTALLQKLL